MARKRSPRKRGGGGGADDVAKAVGAFAKLDARAQVIVLALVVVVAIIAAIAYQRERARRGESQPQPPVATRTEAPATPAPITAGPEVHLLPGNPSDATADPANRANYLLLKPYYALSYNEPAGVPNWVSWRLTRDDIRGTSPRRQVFEPDETLPPGFKRVAHRDYSGSGFDRGHLCPHADRDATPEMAAATFVMTNIIPQAPNLNQGAWADLEDYCRDLVNRERARIYIVAGGIGNGGRGTAGSKQTIASGKVVVPADCWKVILVVPESGGPDDLAKVTPATRVIAVVMPNDNDAIAADWPRYRVSVADVEQRTGYRFFGRLPGDVAAALKQKVDRTPITAPAQRGT